MLVALFMREQMQQVAMGPLKRTRLRATFWNRNKWRIFSGFVLFGVTDTLVAINRVVQIFPLFSDISVIFWVCLAMRPPQRSTPSFLQDYLFLPTSRSMRGFYVLLS